MTTILGKLQGLPKSDRNKLAGALLLAAISIFVLAYLQFSYNSHLNFRCSSNQEEDGQSLVLIDDSGRLTSKQLHDVLRYLNRFFVSMKGMAFKIGFISDNFSETHPYSIGICGNEINSIGEKSRLRSQDIENYLFNKLKYLLNAGVSSSPIIEKSNEFVKFNVDDSSNTDLIIISDFIQNSDQYDLRYRKNEGNFSDRASKIEQIIASDLTFIRNSIRRVYLYEIERAKTFIWQQKNLFPFFERIYRSSSSIVNPVPNPAQHDREPVSGRGHHHNRQSSVALLLPVSRNDTGF